MGKAEDNKPKKTTNSGGNAGNKPPKSTGNSGQGKGLGKSGR